jgi:hypothetical protein
MARSRRSGKRQRAVPSHAHLPAPVQQNHLTAESYPRASEISSTFVPPTGLSKTISPRAIVTTRSHDWNTCSRLWLISIPVPPRAGRLRTNPSTLAVSLTERWLVGSSRIRTRDLKSTARAMATPGRCRSLAMLGWRSRTLRSTRNFSGTKPAFWCVYLPNVRQLRGSGKSRG